MAFMKRSRLMIKLVALVAASLTWPAAVATAMPAQEAYVKFANPGGNENFGWSVAVSGDTMVVGASAFFNQATGVGEAFVFTRSGTNWIPQASLGHWRTVAYDGFGSSVAVSGDTGVVGAPFESGNATRGKGNQDDNSVSNAGAAYVFVREVVVSESGSRTNWTQQAYVKASNTGAGANFGRSVAISGDTVVVGADGEPSSATGVDGDPSGTNDPHSGP